MKAKEIDGDLIGWTESFLPERTVEMVTEGNVLHSHPEEACVPQGSPISLILFSTQTAGLTKWVEERVQAEGPSFVHDLGWVATRKNVNEVVEKLQAGAVVSIEWDSRRDLQFDTAKMEAALVTPRDGHMKHLQPKLTT